MPSYTWQERLIGRIERCAHALERLADAQEEHNKLKLKGFKSFEKTMKEIRERGEAL